jgi:large repetitive protein
MMERSHPALWRVFGKLIWALFAWIKIQLHAASLFVLSLAYLLQLTAASGDPAINPASLSQTTAGAISTTVPDGTCGATISVTGGGGGSSPAGAVAGGYGGTGAVISGTFKVLPSQTVTGVAAGGGVFNSATTAGATSPGGTGYSAGGAAGTVPTGVTHRGGGGGGSSAILIAGVPLIIAGGGGGGGAAHQTQGIGGAAGFTGIAAGGVVFGANGAVGSQATGIVGFGQGGQPAIGGTGGINTGNAAYSGFGGTGIGAGVGGAGGVDIDNDSGGGGGGGYTGGGGGASTVGSTLSGAGGGGGSSYVVATSPIIGGVAPTAVTGVAGPSTPTTAATGPMGAAKIDWLPCLYNLQVTKSVSASPIKAGAKAVWTVTVKNNGPDPMTRGDTVSLADTLPATVNSAVSPAFKVLSISTSGASNTLMTSGTVSCTGVTVGSALPPSTVCSRAYDASTSPGAPAGGTRGLDSGETLTITYEQVTSNKAACTTITNTASTLDRATSSGTTDIIGVISPRSAATPLTVQCYDLGITKTVSPTSAAANQPITWTMVVQNLGLADMQGPDDPASNPLVVTDAPPVSNLSTPTAFTSTGPAGACTYSAGSITCPSSLAAGQTQTFTFKQTPVSAVPVATVFNNTASVVDFNAGDSNDSSTASATVPATKLTLTKISNGGVGAVTFTGNNGWTSQTITTTTQGVGVTGATQSLTAAAVSTTITEAIPAGYTLSSATCTGMGPGGTATPNLATGALILDAAATVAGSNIACTFTNSKTPRLKVQKTTIGGFGGPFTFSQSNLASTPSGITTLSAGTAAPAAPVAINISVLATDVILTENAFTGYALASAACTDANSAITGNTGTLGTLVGNVLTLPASTIKAGADFNCNFTNNKLPTLTLVKTVTNDNGGSLTVPSVTLTATGASTITGITGSASVTSAIVPVGSYALSESTVPGYGAGLWSCTAGTLAGSNLDLALGQNATCTINNNDVAASLTLTKTITNDNGGISAATDFTLQASGPTIIAGTTGAPAVTSANVNAGTYTLSETGPTGYSAGSWSCTAGTLTGNSLVLALGQASTCTVNNNDISPQLTLVKTVTNDNGGTAAVSAFNLSASGPSSITGITGAPAVTNALVDAGIYALSETGPAGYSAGSWSCTAGILVGSNLTLPLNQSATCTINNNDNSPHLTLVKTVTNDDSGTSLVSDFTLAATGPSPISGVTGAVAVTNAAVNAGIYVLSETGPPGYVASKWTCTAGAVVGNNLTLALGQSATCAINNNDQTSFALSVIKTLSSNADEDGSASVTLNDTLTYTVTATNTGTSPQTVIVVSDGAIAPSSLTCPALAPASSCVLIGTHTVTQSEIDAGQVSNTGAASSVQVATAVTDTINTPVSQVSSLTVGKLLNGYSDLDATSSITLGDVLTFQITATNTGTVTQHNVLVVDPKITPNSKTCAIVAPGSTCVLTGTYAVVQVDANSGAVSNTGTASSDLITTPVTSSILTSVTRIVIAAPDSVTGINGAFGQSNVVNAFAGDTVNGLPASISNATLSLPLGVIVPAGLSFDIATGNVLVAAATPAGTYNFNYQICETFNPTNCKIAAISVTVDAAPVVATNDSVSGINGALGQANVVNAFTGDTVNGQPATLANATLSLPSGITVPAGLIFNPATGNVSVVAATPASVYSFLYQLCELLNPTNCQTATMSVTVDAAPVVATPDTVFGINGASGQTNVLNAFTGDTINGSPATIANATLSLPIGITVPAGLSFDVTTGNVSVTAGTPIGSYSFDYQICEQLNPTNCQIATVSVTVDAAPIAANADTPAAVNGATGNASLVNVYDNDLLNGAAVTLSSITGSVLTSAIPNAPGDPVPLLDPATGVVAVPAATPAGSYTISYQICEQLNPGNCATATVTIVVDAAPVVATNDTVTGINGTSGQSNVLNAFAGDTVNGLPATVANATLSLPSGITVPVGLTFDVSTGMVSVVAGTPAGTYSFLYQLCEQLNPSNCQTASISVTVDAAPVVATNDTVTGINGASGASNVVNAFAGDTVNSLPATIANATLSLPIGVTVPTGLSFDTATGSVSVAAATSAGLYSFDYQLCEILNPTNCQIATISVTVDAAPVVAAPDTISGVNGASGQANVVNAFAGDTVNGLPASMSNATLSLPSGVTVPAGLTFDVSTGEVSVVAGTPAGTYSFLYQLCEQLNPSNCQTASITVTVVEAPIMAAADAPLAINGASGGATPSVLGNDTLNGSAVTIGAGGSVSLTPGAAPTPVVGAISMNLDGTMTVAAGTTAGSYAYSYTICESLNPGNCSTAIATIVVAAAPVIATNDTVTGINGASGQASVLNAFSGDTVNGLAATVANATLTLPIGVTVPAGLSFDTATGDVSVASGTAAGTYSFDYQLCEQLNPTNCQTAIITVTVDAAPVVATDDTVTGINGASGQANVLNAFAGDTVNGLAATLANATLSLPIGVTVPAGLSFNTATGDLSVLVATPAGTYSFDYQLCEQLNPSNCQTATISVTVDAALVVATSDTVTGINGASGASNVLNALAGDTINGFAATLANATLFLPSGETVPTGLSFDTATGYVSVTAATTAGTYSFDYQLCESLNPTNCKTATITVTVDAAPILASTDTPLAINGATGGTTASVLGNDTLNAAAVTVGAGGSVSLTLAAAPTPLAGAISMNPDGTVTVAPGTTAGSYPYRYTICEILNPGNCSTAIATIVVVAAPVVATNDTVTGINGASGQANVVNAFTGDTVNGLPATAANAALTLPFGVTVPTGLTFNVSTGDVSVVAGTAAGTYSFDYQICEQLNATNCQIATISVTVDAAPVVATNDSVSGINGASGQVNVVNAFTGDTVNGVTATVVSSILSVATTVPAGLTFDPSTGDVSVAAATPSGLYSFEYRICEALNPTNCAIAQISVTVDVPPLTAKDDTPTSINGASGGTTPSVLANDVLNGNPVTLTNATLTPGLAPTPGAGSIVMNPDGTVTIAAGTTAGTYSYPYTICEQLNPLHCVTALATIVVDQAPILASDDAPFPVNGASGGLTLSVLDNDVLNGTAVSLTTVSITPGTAPTPAAGSIAMNPDGTMTIAPGTTAGSYSYAYTICELLNPLNCSTAIATISVDIAPVVATDDSIMGINGASGQLNVLNAFSGDQINGAPATAANSVLGIAPISTVPAGLVFDLATGNVSVDPATSAGLYSFDYQICEKLNPSNCKIATISVTVVAAPLLATDDTPPSVNGGTGATTPSVLNNDTLNAGAVTVGPTGNSTLTPGIAPTPAAGSIIMNADGTLTVAPGTTAGSYLYSYTICEVLNSTNCQMATATIAIDPSPIVATSDFVSGVNGASGQTDVLNAFAGDEINGQPATVLNAVLTVSSPVPPGLTFDTATGNISVNSATPSGVYTFDYQICELLNPANCKTAKVFVTVVAAPLLAIDDAPPSINGASGNTTASVLDNDTLNGVAVTLGSSTLSPGAAPIPTSGLITMNPDGTVTVAAGTTAGIYNYPYSICEQLNPAHCATAIATIIVDAAPVVATDDTVGGINGLTGQTSILNAFAGDTINGATATPANSVLTVITAVPAGLVFNAATGDVSVPAGTPIGSYSFDYQICELLNPSNCKIATETVTVIAATMVAADDSLATVNGATGGTTASVVANDTLNGSPVSLVTVALTPGVAPSPIAGSIIMNADGTVTVAPGTTAGSYGFAYTICEILNPANCKTAIAIVTVDVAPVVAMNDTVTGINGASGQANVLNAFDGDTINGQPATSANATLSLPTGITVPAGLSFDTATGNVSIAVATPAGSYTFLYQLCEILNLTNCQTATVTVIVDAAPVAATNDAPSPANGATGVVSLVNVYDNDLLNGSPVALSTITGSVLTPATPHMPGDPVPVLDPSTGIVAVPSGTPAGIYTIAYKICEQLNPSNCSTASVTVTVAAAPVVAANDAVTGINGAIGQTNIINAFAGDTVNGLPAAPLNATLSLPLGVILPAGLIFDTVTGNVSVLPGTVDNTYSFNYQLCEKLNPTNCTVATISVGVYFTATVEGTVFNDVNGDGNFGSGDTSAGAGYTVELFNSSGTIVSTATTDAAGKYSLTSVPGTGYSILFTDTAGLVVGRIADITLNAGLQAQQENQPIDPSGVVYNSFTRAPVAGVGLVITDTVGNPLPTSCLVSASQQNQVTTSSGAYRFDLVPGANAACPVGQTQYKIQLSNPSGYVAGFSVNMPPQAGALDSVSCPVDPIVGGACQVSANPVQPSSGLGVYYIAFRISSSSLQVVHNHIPIDPIPVAESTFTKTASKAEIRRGERVVYVIEAKNQVLNPARIVDVMPVGFNFVEGSATVNGFKVKPKADGNALSFGNLVPDKDGHIKIQLTLVSTVAASAGDYINHAQLLNAANGQVVALAKASVRILPEHVFDCGEVIGKVFDDKNRNGYQDDGEEGLPGVLIATVKGLLVTTDKFGRFHVGCADIPDKDIGSNFLMKLDTRTLPTGYRITTENPRDVRLTRGKITKLNFGASISRVVKLDLNGKVFQPGSTSLAVKWQGQLPALVETLDAEPSTLRLNYYVQGDNSKLAAKRVAAVEKLITQMWAKKRSRYKLPIETRVLGVDGAPSND